MINKISGVIIILAIWISACNLNSDVNQPLPILGFKEYVNGDTLFHKISDFEFIDQDSNIVTNETFKNKIYVTDMFFTTCPSICPIVKRNMLTLYEEFENEDRLKFLSHTIDVKYDKIPVLKAYADNIQISSDRWHLVTGDEEKIFAMADEYFIVAKKDSDAPGGFDHSGKLILVDSNRHVRGFCEGTEAESVAKFMNDIRKLLNEM